MTSSSRTARPKRQNVKPIVIQEDGRIAQEQFTDDDLAFFQGWQPVTNVMGKDVEECTRVGKAIGAIPKSCWRNALRVVQKLDEHADASYIEGIACLDGCPLIEHGWVCRSDGTVIDPTLPRRSGLYFPGLEFKGRSGIEEFLATAQGRAYLIPPFFYAFGWGGRHSPSIGRAWQQGWAFMKERWPEAFKDFEPPRLTDIWDVQPQGDDRLLGENDLPKVQRS